MRMSSRPIWKWARKIAIALLVDELSSPRLLRSPYKTYSQTTQRELDIVDMAASLRSALRLGLRRQLRHSKKASVSDLLETD